MIAPHRPCINSAAIGLSVLRQIDPARPVGAQPVRQIVGEVGVNIDHAATLSLDTGVQVKPAPRSGTQDRYPTRVQSTEARPKAP